MCTQANDAQVSCARVLVFRLMTLTVDVTIQIKTITNSRDVDHGLMGVALIWVRESKTGPEQAAKYDEIHRCPPRVAGIRNEREQGITDR